MSTLERIGHWGDTHHPAWLDILRIGLGGFLFWKGVEFGSHPQDLRALIEGTDISLVSFFSIHYIVMVHLVGGLLIAMGLVTRVAILFQLPILLGAVLLMNSNSGMFDAYAQGEVTIVTLVLLFVFLVIGSGPFSMDEYMRRNNNA
jgi:putative oxidoreductase